MSEQTRLTGPLSVADLMQFKAERDAALAAIQRVRELHNKTTMGGCGDPKHCSPYDSEPICGSCLAEWPCPTIKALDGSHE